MDQTPFSQKHKRDLALSVTGLLPLPDAVPAWERTLIERAYARVSTAEQAERDLSLPAQCKAIAEFAARDGAVIAQEYVEAGASGTDASRPVFNRLLGDALKPTSTISTVVVHHTSRFTRDATHARVVKTKLRKAGVRAVFVLQDFADAPMGTLMEGLFECIDQYE